MKTFLFVTIMACAIACISARFTGSLSANPGKEVVGNVALQYNLGNEKANIGGIGGNTLNGPVTTGALLDANKNSHELSLQHENTPGFGKTLTETGRVNDLFNDNTHKIDANAFHSNTKLENGYKFGKVGDGRNHAHANGQPMDRTPKAGREAVGMMRNINFNDNTRNIDAMAYYNKMTQGIGKIEEFGGKLNYNHIDGHSVGITASRIPQYDRNTIGMTGNANLWTSPDRHTSLNLYGSSSWSFGGHQRPSNNFGIGIGLSHRFR